MNIKERMVDFVSRFDPHFLQSITDVIDEQKNFHPVDVDLDDKLGDIITAYASNGKRIRPFLIEYLSGKTIDNKDVLNTTLSAELFHLIALIHDDIMDQSKLRRGVKTVHTAIDAYSVHNKRLGEDVALMIGDSFLVESLRYAARAPKEVFDEISMILQKTIRGQYLDVFGMNTAYGESTHEIVQARESLKTAWYTFAGPAQLGLMLRDEKLSQEHEQLVVDTYLEIGFLYQIRDDIIDCSKDRKDKTPFEDIVEGQTTWVTLYIKEHFPEKHQAIVTARDINDRTEIEDIFNDIDLATPYQQEFEKRVLLVENLKAVSEEMYTKTKEVLELLKLN